MPGFALGMDYCLPCSGPAGKDCSNATQGLSIYSPDTHHSVLGRKFCSGSGGERRHSADHSVVLAMGPGVSYSAAIFPAAPDCPVAPDPKKREESDHFRNIGDFLF